MRTFAAVLFLATLTASTHYISSAPVDQSQNDFHIMDEFGGYHFGYNDGRIARQEERSQEGVVRGAYTFVDANGQIQTVTYTSDKHNGFLVSGTNIPKLGRIPEIGEIGEIIEETPSAVVEDTPEVAAAKVKHLEAVRSAQLGQVNSIPVLYTSEVAAARAEHLNIYNAEVLRNRGDVPVVYAGQPAMQYVPNVQYHPDYLPYIGL